MIAEYIHTMELSYRTLLLLFVLPFAYYGYSLKYWFYPKRVRALNGLLVLLAVLLSIPVLMKLGSAAAAQDQKGIELALLHLFPPALALLAMWHGRHETAAPAPKQARRVGESDSSFAPKKLNEQVEKLTWDDLVISTELKQELNSVIALLQDPGNATKYGIQVPKGILFSGPPGTGKTTIAKVVANTAGLSFFALRADEVVSKWVGDSEKNLSRLFEAATQNTPAVIFIDEVDALGKKRSDAHAAHEDNLLNHLLQLIDGVVKSEGIYVIAATNRPDLVDEALKRAGRLNRVIEIPLPELEARRDLFQLYLSSLQLEEAVDIEILAKVTDGNSAADIREICNQAGLHAFRREADLPKEQRRYLITSEDIEAALSEFAVDEDELDPFDGEKGDAQFAPLNSKIETLGWDDLIIDAALQEELSSVISLLQDQGTAERYGIDVPKGILLNGPPGTGKTTLAKVIANTAQLSFFVLKMDEVVSKWVGESEKNLTKLFKAAMKHAPSVIFIDEVDSIGKSRAEGNAQHADNLLNHLLQLIDGVVKTEGLYVIAATNRADLVDPALKRGGRLNRTIEIPLPDHKTREALFELYMARLNMAVGVELEQLARLTDGKAGADIKAICNQAGLNAFKRESRNGNRDFLVQPQDLEGAIRDYMRAAA